MDAAIIARVMSVIPERAAWTHSGTDFAAHENQGAQVLYLARFLQWLSPLTVLTKDDQRALGLIATHQRPVDADLEALERQLGDLLGLRVKVAHGKSGGTVALHYSTLDQLDLICQRLSGEPI